MTRLSRKQRKAILTNQESIDIMPTEITNTIEEITITNTTEPIVEQVAEQSVESITEVVVEEPVPVVETVVETPVVIPAILPIVQETVTEVPVVADVINKPKYLKMADKYRETGTPAEKGFFEVLDKFVKIMRRSHYMKEDVAVMEQVQFYQALEYIIDTTPPAFFRNFWSSVLAVCAENMGDNDVFSAQNCIRHVNKWPLGNIRLNKYLSLLNLIIFTAKPADRLNLDKVMSLRKLIEQDFSQQGRQNLESFYRK